MKNEITLAISNFTHHSNSNYVFEWCPIKYSNRKFKPCKKTMVLRQDFFAKSSSSTGSLQWFDSNLTSVQTIASSVQTIASSVPYNTFSIYKKESIIISLDDGNYETWSVTPTSTTKIGTANLGKASKKMYYFRPDPNLYIHHTCDSEGIYRYTFTSSTCDISPKSNYESFDFGIGDLAFRRQKLKVNIK